MKKIAAVTCIALVVASSFLPVDASAQRYRYMDSSGNIHFVESWKQVPREFRDQIVPPTPTPVLDAKARRQFEHEKERQVRDAQRKAEKRKREIEKNLKNAQKQNRAAGANGSAPPVEKSRGGADNIEMIR